MLVGDGTVADNTDGVHGAGRMLVMVFGGDGMSYHRSMEAKISCSIILPVLLVFRWRWFAMDQMPNAIDQIRRTG